MPDTVFETERFVVRPLTPADAEACFVIYGDPEVTRYVTTGGAPIPSIEILRHLLERGMLALQPEARFGFWALERRTDLHVVGTVALIPVEDSEDEFELGWHLSRGCWGMGYAFESGVGLLRYGFDRLGLERILALAHPDNERSARACHRIGMLPLGLRNFKGAEHRCFAAERAAWTPPTHP